MAQDKLEQQVTLVELVELALVVQVVMVLKVELEALVVQVKLAEQVV